MATTSTTSLPKIDIIVPCFNTRFSMLRLLSSIASQTILPDLTVTLVNDAGQETYEDFVSMFKPYMEIQELTLEKNAGPGGARAYGYLNTNNPLVTWIDADDTFANAFSLEILRRNLLSEPGYHCCWSTFIEENQEGVFIPHPQDTIWMFGKLYTRAWLDRWDIKFDTVGVDMYGNEDNSFNMAVKLLSSPEQKIKFIQDTTYFWHKTDTSITRRDNCDYSFNRSFTGYAKNLAHAINFAEKKNPFSSSIMYMKVETMMNLYVYYIEAVARRSELTQQNWDNCKYFYLHTYREIKDKISDEILREVYNNCMRNAYMGNRLQQIVPSISVYDFFDKLEKESN